MMEPKNIILIGMPGAGKSTIGVLLAKALGKAFIDTDLLIQAQEGRLLQEIIDEQGINRFLEIEAKVLMGLKAKNSVIATGGSAIYSDQAMTHLKHTGIIVYLKLTYEEIEQRIKNMASRGIAIAKGKTLFDLYRERTPKYEGQADLTLDCSGRSIEESVRLAKEELERVGFQA
jgi:shikimate kinase